MSKIICTYFLNIQAVQKCKSINSPTHTSVIIFHSERSEIRDSKQIGKKKSALVLVKKIIHVVLSHYLHSIKLNLLRE